MRTISILLTLSLLAIVPSTTAEPGYECKEQGVSGSLVTAGLGRDCKLDAELLPGLICVYGGYHVEQDVRGHEVAANACRLPLDIAIEEGRADCRKVAGGTNNGLADATLTQGCKAHVLVLGGMYCLWGQEDRGVRAGGHSVLIRTCSSGPDPRATSGTPERCPERSLTVKHADGTTVSSHYDCTFDVVLFPDIICVGAWTAKREYDVGPVHVTQHYCRFPGPEPW